MLRTCGLSESFVSIVPRSYTAEVSALFWSSVVVAKPAIAESTSVFK